MLVEYDFSNAKKNPYSDDLKKQLVLIETSNNDKTEDLKEDDNTKRNDKK